MRRTPTLFQDVEEEHPDKILAPGVIQPLISDPGNSERALVPRTLRGEIMRLCYDVPTAGHQGMTRSLDTFPSEFSL